MQSSEEIRKNHLEWLNDPDQTSQESGKSKFYAGKTISNIRYYGNGEEMITFTDGTRLLYSVSEPDSGDDLYSKTEKEFNFSTWKYREQEAEEAKGR